MIYRNREQEKIKANKKWHSWFAWFPVTLESGERAWLETVERKWWFVPGMMSHGTDYRKKK